MSAFIIRADLEAAATASNCYCTTPVIDAINDVPVHGLAKALIDPLLSQLASDTARKRLTFGVHTRGDMFASLPAVVGKHAHSASGHG